MKQDRTSVWTGNKVTTSMQTLGTNRGNRQIKGRQSNNDVVQVSPMMRLLVMGTGDEAQVRVTIVTGVRNEKRENGSRCYN
jgi:hypothetical protein